MRIDQRWMDGWEFAWQQPGAPEPPEADYQPVFLPHDFVIGEAQDPKMRRGSSQGYLDRCGTGWYRKVFTCTPEPDQKYYLDFDGVSEEGILRVNGHRIALSRYAYSPSRVEIGSFLKEGENSVIVTASTLSRPRDRWYSGGGLYRTVRWIQTGPNALDERNVRIITGFPGKADQEAIVTVYPGCDRPVRVSLNGRDVVCTESKAVIRVEHPHLWSAEDPYLYDLHLNIDEEPGDTLIYRIGIRKTEWIPRKGLFINDKPVKLQGVCVHQDVACRGIAATADLWRDRLRTLKEMGCNAIRAAHHLYSREFVDLCDEMGFYLYEEAFDKWRSGSYARYFDEDHLKDLDAMVLRDRNHPSILIWGVGNEVEYQGQKTMLRILQELVDRVHELDPTRPVSYAMNPHFKYESHVDASKVEDIQKFVDEADDTEITDLGEKIERIAGIGRIVDIISCNYQDQWYPAIHEAMPDKLILGTESVQLFNGVPEEMQNFLIQPPILTPLRYPYVVGSLIWTGIGYLGETGSYPNRGWGAAPIRSNGARRPMFDYLKSILTKDPMIRIAIEDYSYPDDDSKGFWTAPPFMEHWDFPQFKRGALPYAIFTNCEEAELYVNDRRIYLPRPSDCPGGMIRGYLPWQKGHVDVYGLCRGERVCEFHLRTPDIAVRLEWEEAPGTLCPGQEKILLVRAVDAAGTYCARESSLVRFRTEGAVEIVAVDNGNFASQEPYQAAQVHLYRGEAGVLVRAAGKGRGVVSATGNGLQEAAITVYAE